MLKARIAIYHLAAAIASEHRALAMDDSDCSTSDRNLAIHHLNTLRIASALALHDEQEERQLAQPLCYQISSTAS